MIRLATVFSGIGSIEHALDRMQLEHKIVFACDNGDVEILTKNVGMNIDDIGNELDELNENVSVIYGKEDVQDLYKNQLLGMLHEAQLEYATIVDSIKEHVNPPVALVDVLQSVLSSESMKPARHKEYTSFMNTIEFGSQEQRLFRQWQIILEIINDFKKDNALEDLGNVASFNSSDGIEWELVADQLMALHNYLEDCHGKKVIRKVQDLSQRISQLHEKINYIGVQKTLEAMGEDWDARKKYVDSLYAGLESRNKVKQSYMANYPLSEKDFHWNVAFLDGRQYKGAVDLFVGGSPCQSFSFVGKQRGLDDTRGTLFYEYARLIHEIEPKVFIYENVRAVLTHDGGKTWEKMNQVFEELGYEFQYAWWLDAC